MFWMSGLTSLNLALAFPNCCLLTKYLLNFRFWRVYLSSNCVLYPVTYFAVNWVLNLLVYLRYEGLHLYKPNTLVSPNAVTEFSFMFYKCRHIFFVRSSLTPTRCWKSQLNLSIRLSYQRCWTVSARSTRAILWWQLRYCLCCFVGAQYNIIQEKYLYCSAKWRVFQIKKVFL